jgi:hypothetical protein
MEQQRWDESEKRREEERRSEKRKSQKKEDLGAQKGRKVAKHCVTTVKILRNHSEWTQVKRTENELKRHECLRLFDECCHFNRDWIHTEIRQRQAANARAKQESHAAEWQRWQ